MSSLSIIEEPAPGWPTVTNQSLGWLAAGNAVGLLLATLLLVPAWNADLAPFTFGRWVPVHLNIQLYGWSSLPLVGLLFRALLPARGWDRAAGWATAGWSVALAFGCVSWLAGWTSGKPFVEWAGPARVVFAALLMALAIFLCLGYRARLRSQPEAAGTRAGKLAVLALLLVVPFSLFLAARPGVYPPLNPDSGGATGGSLLGSTLGIIAIYLAAPRLAGRPARGGLRGDVLCWALFVLHVAGFSLLKHGDESHHDWSQIVGLSSLVIWIPVLRLHLRRFTWPAAARPWLVAMLVWGAALVFTACFTFLPGMLERSKFTHALVAHSHLAMAGLITSFNFALLAALAPPGPTRDHLGNPIAFASWQGGLLLHLLVLAALGEWEALAPHALFIGSGTTDFLLVMRMLSGLVLFSTAAWWWHATLPDFAPATEEITP